MTPTLSLWAALLMAPLAALAAPAESLAKPNILFLFADDQRADTIAALGNPIIKTPNLDRLVHSGVAFNRAYMQGGFNGATCVPSRAMLADQPEQSAKTTDLTALLEKEMQRSGDTGALKAANPKPAEWTSANRGKSP